MKHYLRAAYGTSQTYYDASAYPTMHGVGQGNGAATAIWAAVSSLLLEIQRAAGFGAHVSNPISPDQIHIAGYAFMDDMDLPQTSLSLKPPGTACIRLQEALDYWQGSLAATGGALVPSKSFWVACEYE